MNWVMFKVAANKTFFIFFMKATRRKLYFRMKSKKKLKISFADETVIFSFNQYVQGMTVRQRLSADNLTKIFKR